MLVLVAVEMWQEARKQEKFIRGVMIDYKRRAERRKGFYDKIVITQNEYFYKYTLIQCFIKYKHV